MGPDVDSAALLGALGAWTTGPGPLHRRLERSLVRAIRRGDLPPGVRLPAERTLAAHLSVSRGTVVAAVSALRDAGWLASRQGSGTWVRVDAPRPLAVVADPPSVADRSRRLSGRLLEPDLDVVDLAVSSLRDLDVVPAAFLASIDPQELLTEGQEHGYQPFGSPRLREALAARYRAAGLATSADQVLVTSGAQQAVSLAAAALVRPGEAVIIESPTYPGAIDALARVGARLVPVPAEATWPSTAVLREAVRACGARVVYLMPACRNPLGTVMTTARRRELGSLADELGLTIIADDLLELVTDDPQPPALATFSRRERVVTVSSLSKVVWGGLRVGWLRGPVDLVAQLGRTRAAADYGMSAVSQLLAGRLLEHLDDIARTRRDQVRARRTLTEQLVAQRLPGWELAPAAGGQSLWARLPVGTGDGFEQHAQRAGVHITPGSAHSVDESTRSFVRISTTQPPDVLAEGVERLARAWRSYLAAVDRHLAATRSAALPDLRVVNR